MEKVNHNIYLKELETSLATVKASLILNEESAQTEFKKAGITEKSAKHIKKDLEEYLDKTTKYYGTVSQINNHAEQVLALVNKAVSLADVASSDETLVAKNMATAAKSIEAAMEAIAILSSDAASINAKAASEDDNTKISKIASEANKRGLEAAEKAEEATMSSLNATILAAKSNAKFINTLITDLAKDVTTLNSAISATAQAAKTNMDTASKNYSEAITNCANDELALEKATVDFNSAKEANNEETIKLGLAEALKIAKEDKKADSTKK